MEQTQEVRTLVREDVPHLSRGGEIEQGDGTGLRSVKGGQEVCGISAAEVFQCGVEPQRHGSPFWPGLENNRRNAATARIARRNTSSLSTVPSLRRRAGTQCDGDFQPLARLHDAADVVNDVPIVMIERCLDEGTRAARFLVGPLPPLGQWVRLEVPARAVGLEGSILKGMAFTLYGGQATWDWVGKRPSAAVSIQPGSFAMTLSWPSVPGQTYRVLYKTDLAAHDWNEISGPITATDSTTSWTDITIDFDYQRFYQIVQ